MYGRRLCVAVVSGLIVHSVGAGKDLKVDEWPVLNAQAEMAAGVPVRQGGIGGAPFWNAVSRAFINPPAFDFKPVAGAAAYRFTVTEKSGGKASSFTAPLPTAALTPVWRGLKPGYVTVVCEGLASDGAVLGVAGRRDCYRAAVFKGPYPARACDYRTCAARVYEAVWKLRYVRDWLTCADPPEGYDLYCYPAKILSAMIRALCGYVRSEPADRGQALAVARKMADWLLAQSQPADAPLAYFPPTYRGDRRQEAVRFKGQNMLLYPAFAADAYFDLAAVSDETKYRDAALAIARTYVKLQGADGTWPLKVTESDGCPVRPNRLTPDDRVLRMLDRASAETGDPAFKTAGEKAFCFILDGPCVKWNWDGQFEDIDPVPPYQNLQKGIACETARRLFELRGDNPLSRELVAWCEDQFTVWSDPIHHMDWEHWKTPTALEQYAYYTPIDASMGDMITAFAAAYAATGERLYLAKAEALADNITRNQRADGTIPTYFDSRPGSDWVNCMVFVAKKLEYLAACRKQIETKNVNQEQ